MDEHPQENEYISKADVKRERAESAARRRNIKKTLWIFGAIVIGAGVVAGGIWWTGRQAASAPGEFYPSIGQQHISLTNPLPAPYNSNPPSSGGHFPSPANWGIYDSEVNDRFFIHNLEHGGIWISYRPSVDAHVVEHLKAIVEEFGGSKLVMGPRSANDMDVAVAAWTRVLKFNLTDGDITDEQLNQIRAFYKAYKNRGPEFVPDTMPGVNPKDTQK